MVYYNVKLKFAVYEVYILWTVKNNWTNAVNCYVCEIYITQQV